MYVIELKTCCLSFTVEVRNHILSANKIAYNLCIIIAAIMSNSK